ncbi:MAG TPA: efflux RND transporter periplasmic adaptor subunit [Steroidobacteraceae bacterium]|nr:efflux RND transporter periplasmic adaptor subunit [Steroidobacteraceae bacterium]
MTSRVQLMIAAVAALLVAACGKQQGMPEMPPPEVGVIVVHAKPVAITREASARLAPTRASDVRARVPGVLQKRLYKEGSMVKEGQLLMQIDPAPYRAALNVATANLAQAEAAATNAKVTADRNRELAKQALVSRRELDDAEALERSTAAQVAAARAQVEAARINLGYANVTAPISGRASQLRVLEGALVGQGEATLLTTIEQVDPIYVYFDQPASEFERLRRAQAEGQVTIAHGDKAEVRVIRQDGSEYPHVGTLDFSDFSVNPTTGAVAFRGVVPNPDHLLLPGMYVTVQLTAGMLNRGFEVPQLAVQRDQQGAYVLAAGADGMVAAKRVDVVSTAGVNWVIGSGLEDGDQVIVSGLQLARPGIKVAPKPAGEAPQEPGQGGAAPGAAPAAASGS